jgi:hypothetical protein
MPHVIVIWFSLNMFFAGLVPDFNRNGQKDLADYRLAQQWCDQVEQIKLNLRRMGVHR